MISTITLNPALDRTLWVKTINPGGCNRIESGSQVGWVEHRETQQIL